MNIAIIGSSAASKSAVSTLLAQSGHEHKISIITKDTRQFYSRVLLPDFIAGHIAEDDLNFVESDFLIDERISVISGTAQSIDIKTKKIFVDGVGHIGYDKLIIATGASPTRLSINNSDLEGIHYLRDFEDAFSIKQESEGIMECIVIGGGLVSLKAAWALKETGKVVTVLVESGRLLSRVLDKTASEIVRDIFEKNDISIVLNAPLEEFINNNGHVSGVRLKDGRAYRCGLAVIGKGVRPNVELVSGTGIAADKGIMVNKRMETSAKDVYAAGDVTQSVCLLTGETDVFTLWPDAVEQGKIAAYNILGIDREYLGGLGMNSFCFFGIPFVSIGLVMEKDISGCDVYANHDVKNQIYRKIVVKGGKAVGAVFAGDIGFSGMMYWDIKSGRTVDQPCRYLSKSGLQDIYIERNRQLV